VPAFDDIGLTNGVVYYYVVTATDARQESLPSDEAAARPEEPLELVAEVVYDPSTLTAECLLARGGGHRGAGSGLGQTTRRARHDDDDDDCDDDESRCPKWVYANVELPPGYIPESIDLLSLRLLGSVPPDLDEWRLVDFDDDGVVELRVRFPLDGLVPFLAVGVNHVTITGRAGAIGLQGTNIITVTPLAADLRMSPRTLKRRSGGQEVLAKLTFAPEISAEEVEVSSILLNETVPVERVVSSSGRHLILKFDRGEVFGVLPTGDSVQVRVGGTLHGFPFEAVDYVRVKD
jgi:hypothetical protein